MPIEHKAHTRTRKSMMAVNVGLVANIFLAVTKTSIGILGHSQALLADGINSTSDVAYNVVLWVFMRLAGKPADTEHPYGHRQLESIAALVVGSFVITTAITIFWDSINYAYELLSGTEVAKGAASVALWVALLTAVLKVGLYFYTQRIGESTANAGVLALAYDHRNDILSASGAALGIFLGRRGYYWVDPAAGALVALVILRTGIEVLRESSAELMDAVPGRALARHITGLLDGVEGVRTVEEIHAHRFGPYLVVNVTVGVDGSLSVADGDAIATTVERTLYENVDFLRRAYVHYHPAGS